MCTLCVYVYTQLTLSTTLLNCLCNFFIRHTHTPPPNRERCSSLPYKVVYTHRCQDLPFLLPHVIPTLLVTPSLSSLLPNTISAKIFRHTLSLDGYDEPICRHTLSLDRLDEPATCSKRIGAIINGGGKFVTNSSAFYNRFLSGHLISRVSLYIFLFLSFLFNSEAFL